MTLSEAAVSGVAPVSPADIAHLGTVDVPTAGRICGLGRDAAYAAAKRGEIPCLVLGHKMRVPVGRLFELIGYIPDAPAAPLHE